MATADPRDLRMMAEAWGEEFFPTPPEDDRPKDAAAAYVLRRMAVPHLLACADEIERLRTSIGYMADDNSPHDAQAAAQRIAAEWDEGWREQGR